MMKFAGSILLFLLAGFAGWLLNVDRRSTLGFVLVIALPIAGVYFLGWLALLMFVLGLAFGGRVFWSNVNRNRNE
jgi:hypothetical protein